MSSMSRKAGLVTILAVAAALGNAYAGGPTLKDLAPAQDHAAAQARINEQNMKRVYDERQAATRVKSDAERTIDNIPKETTIRPSYPPLGVTVTTPIKN